MSVHQPRAAIVSAVIDASHDPASGPVVKQCEKGGRIPQRIWEKMLAAADLLLAAGLACRGSGVPYPYGLIVAGGCQALAVRAERHARDHMGVALQAQR